MKQQAVRRWLFPGALSAILAGGAFWLVQSPGTGPDTPTHATPEPTLASSTQAPDTPTPKPSGPDAPSPEQHRTPATLGPEGFAASLAGTEIDGSLRADSAGHLIVDLQTRDFFDYFLSTVGEVSPETAIAQIQQLARQHLPPQAAREAMELLDQYLAYKQAALEVLALPLDTARAHDPAYQYETMKRAFSELTQLRRSTFSPEAHAAFFGMEEAYSEYTLAAFALQQRDDLSDQSRQALMAWHREQLPEPLRATEQRLQADAELSQARVAIMDTSLPPETIRKELTALGMAPDEADDVLRYLDQQKTFDTRFTRYQQEARELSTEGLPEADRLAEQERLLERHFPNEQEQTWARLRLLDNS